MTGNVAIVATTFNRLAAVQRLVRSIRSRWPDVPVYIGDQSKPDPFMDEFYDAHRVSVVRLPMDCGVSAARNAIVRVVAEEFFLLCDDDMILTEDTDWTVAQAFLEHHAEVGVVGGRCRDISFSPGHRTIRNLFWDLLFMHDPRAGNFVTMPSHMLEAPALMLDGHAGYFCDSVINFALFRRSVFDAVIRWDERYTCNGEHEDFYLNWKHDGRHRVLYFPGMVCDHHRPPQSGYAVLRERSEGWAAFMTKWGISRHLEFGYGLRTLDDVGHIKEMSDDEANSALLAAMHEARLRKYLGDDAFFGDGVAIPWRRPESAWTAPIDADVFMAHRREHVQGEDFILHVMASHPGMLHGEEARMQIHCTWIMDGVEIVVNDPVDLHAHCLAWGEWTAFAIPVPSVDGVLELRLVMRVDEGVRVASASTVIVGRARRLPADDDHVVGWTRARRGEPGGEAMKDAEEVGIPRTTDLSMLRVTGVRGGAFHHENGLWALPPRMHAACLLRTVHTSKSSAVTIP